MRPPLFHQKENNQMQGKKVYIQNTYTADIQIDVKKDGRFRKTFVFGRFVTDKYTGMVASDGYTELSEEDFALLKDDRAFKYALDKGTLVIQDKAPLRAGNFEQMMEMQQRNAELEAENASLRERLAKYEKPEDGGEKAPDDGLDGMSYEELKAKAAEMGIELKANSKKKAVIEAIRAKAGE